MAAIITNKLRIYNAQQFIESLSEATPLWQPSTSYAEGDVVLFRTNLYIAVEAGTSFATDAGSGPTHTDGIASGGVTLKWAFYNVSLFNNLYLGIGKHTQWELDSNPPTPADSSNNHAAIKQDLIAMKKVLPSSISLAIPRIDWRSDRVYTMYDDQNPEEIIPNGYVITEGQNQYNVFKCISNKKWINETVGVAETTSTVDPYNLDQQGIPKPEADGYIWKYMYSIQLDRALKFLTKDYIPIKNILSIPQDTTSADYVQWNVQQNAKQSSNGIDHITIDPDTGNAGHAGGVGYHSPIELSPSAASPISITNNQINLTFNCGESNSVKAEGANKYLGYALVVFGADGNVYKTKITQYSYANDSNQNEITLEFNSMSDIPSAGINVRTLIITPDVEINGDGVDASAYALTQSGQISEIVIVNRGTGYTYASAQVVVDHTPEVECNIRPIMAPSGSHGSNPVEELGGFYGMIALKLEYDEQETRSSGGQDYTRSIFPVRSSGDFNAVFRQVSILADPVDKITDRIATETRYRGPSHPDYNEAETAHFDVVAGSGKVLYVENRQPVSRADDQIEDIKVVFEF